VGAADIASSAISQWDPKVTERFLSAVRPMVKGWHRAEVRGLDDFPCEGALVVANHSGGMFAMDVPVFATDFYAKFGYGRPLYTLSHDILFRGAVGDFFRRAGLIPADAPYADEALRSGGVVLVFPGGYYDVYRPTSAANRIEFHGRTGYVRVALRARVPIVPAVSIGGQENQLFITRGDRLAKMIGLSKLKVDILPISFGLPFGLAAVLPVNFPLPAKITTQVLPPIDVITEFGENPDVAEVDSYVRAVMQRGLDALAAERRLPVLG